MSRTNAAVSSTMLHVLLQTMAEGKIQPHNMLTSVSADVPVVLNGWSGKYVKRAPGDFLVTSTRDGNEEANIPCSSAVEAKMTLLQLAADEIKNKPH